MNLYLPKHGVGERRVAPACWPRDATPTLRDTTEASSRFCASLTAKLTLSARCARRWTL